MPLFGQTRQEQRRQRRDDKIIPSSGYADDRLTAEHLRGPTEMEIESAEIASFYARDVGRIGKRATVSPIPSIVVLFVDVSIPLITTPPQQQALARICGSKAWQVWPGHTVTLIPRRGARRTTFIDIEPAPPAQQR